MSELAKTYFQQRSEAFNIETPDILSGDPEPLYPEDAYHSLTRSDLAEADNANNRYRELITETGRYLLAVTAASQGIRDADFSSTEAPRIVRAIPDFYAAYKRPLQTGQLRKLTLEAIATEEMVPQYVREYERLGWPEGASTPDNEEAQAFLLVSGEHWQGGRLRGRTGRLVHVRAKQDMTGFLARALSFRVENVAFVNEMYEQRANAVTQQYL